MKLNKITTIFFCFLAIILIGAIYIRIQGISTGNILFLFDNGRDLLYTQKIVLNHKLLLIGPSSGGLQGYFHGVLWYYILAIPFFLGNGNPVTMTLFMIFGSLASIIIAFLTIKKITNIYGGIIAALFFAFSYFSVSTSKFIWNPYPIVWLTPIYFFLLYSLCNENVLQSLPKLKKIIPKNYILYTLFFLTSLIIHFEAIYGICLIPTLIILSISNLRKEILKTKIKQIIIYLLIFSIPIFPTIVFDLRHHFLISSSLVKIITTSGSNISHLSNENPLSLNQRLILRFNDYYKYTVGSITGNNFINMLIFTITILGIITARRKILSSGFLFPIIFFITVTVPFIFFLSLKYEVWDYYWIGNPPLYALFVAYIIGNMFKNNIKYHIFYVTVLMLIIFGLNPINLLNKATKGEIGPGTTTLSTEIKVINAIYKDVGQSNFSVYLHTPPVYDYIYRYLFSWIGRTQGKNLPIDQKQRIIYLILEPSISDPDGIYFKQNTLKTFQKPDKTFIVPGGLRIEKIITLPTEKEVDPNYFPPINGG